MAWMATHICWILSAVWTIHSPAMPSASGTILQVRSVTAARCLAAASRVVCLAYLPAQGLEQVLVGLRSGALQHVRLDRLGRFAGQVARSFGDGQRLAPGQRATPQRGVRGRQGGGQSERGVDAATDRVRRQAQRQRHLAVPERSGSIGRTLRIQLSGARRLAMLGLTLTVERSHRGSLDRLGPSGQLAGGLHQLDQRHRRHRLWPGPLQLGRQLTAGRQEHPCRGLAAQQLTLRLVLIDPVPQLPLRPHPHARTRLRPSTASSSASQVLLADKPRALWIVRILGDVKRSAGIGRSSGGETSQAGPSSGLERRPVAARPGASVRPRTAGTAVTSWSPPGRMTDTSLMRSY